MTSFPPRIKDVAKVWFSIFQQNVDKEQYHCVLVLAEPEFPNKEKDLPIDLQTIINNGLVELIWHPTNIKSHKKLMPTLAKYPNADILVIDDDVIRPQGWLKCFIEDHKKYPEDIITGLITFRLYNNTFTRFSNERTGNTNYGKIIPDGRPANGHGGTLYPAHTFNDQRFFDENLFMKLSPSSDESWQFFFNRLEHKNIRLISKAFNIWNFVKGSQEQRTALWRVNVPNNGYDKIWNNLLKNLI